MQSGSWTCQCPLHPPLFPLCPYSHQTHTAHTIIYCHSVKSHCIDHVVVVSHYKVYTPSCHSVTASQGVLEIAPSHHCTARLLSEKALGQLAPATLSVTKLAAQPVSQNLQPRGCHRANKWALLHAVRQPLLWLQWAQPIAVMSTVYVEGGVQKKKKSLRRQAIITGASSKEATQAGYITVFATDFD